MQTRASYGCNAGYNEQAGVNVSLRYVPYDEDAGKR